jgi:hypothetical protein
MVELVVYYAGYADKIVSIIAAMKSKYSSRIFCHRIALLTIVTVLCSCDANFFGRDSRELAGGYGLKRVGDSNQIALTIPNRSGGIVIDEIGWREPFIIARASGSDYWEAINTSRAQRISVSDQQRKSDPAYRSIPTEAAETAWAKLNRRKRLW